MGETAVGARDYRRRDAHLEGMVVSDVVDAASGAGGWARALGGYALNRPVVVVPVDRGAQPLGFPRPDEPAPEKDFIQIGRHVDVERSAVATAALQG
jgi:hypothetical protein